MAAEQQNPYEAPSTETNPPLREPKSARQQLLPVAVALVVSSVLHIFGGLYYFVFVYSVVADPDADPENSHQMITFCMYYGITMLYCLVLISGAFSMLRQGSYLWAMSVCILALVPLLGPCYFLAIPFGIWGIVVLRRPDVRDSFAMA